MTDQELFDTVAVHLITQGERATMQDPETGLARCVYRAADGKKCAVGCLIPDDYYEEHSHCIEKKQAWQLIDEGIEPLQGLNVTLLGILQQIHDRKDPKEWHNELFSLAASLGYDYGELERVDFVRHGQ